MENEKANRDGKSIKPIIGTLESLFSILNKKYFKGRLQKPVIVISPDSKKGQVLGWCTAGRVWSDGEKRTLEEIENMTEEELKAFSETGYYEISITSESLVAPFEQVAGTMLHEMVHLSNAQRGIQDTSRNGYYHNKRFKQGCDECGGLIVTKTKGYGYAYTELTSSAQGFVESLGIDFELYRRSAYDWRKCKPDADKMPSSRKYQCPKCGASVRATKAVHIGCLDCNCNMKEM